jgi:hypothetical protein
MSWRRWSRRVRRSLGLPAVSRRAALWILLLFVGLAFLSVTVFSDFATTLSQYRFQHYEPKDFQREEHVEPTSKPPKER